MSVHREENSNRPWKKSLFLYIRVYDENLNSSIIFLSINHGLVIPPFGTHCILNDV